MPDNRREPLVAANLGEGVLIPAGDATARIVGEGQQPFGPDPQDIHQMPYVHRGRPDLAGALRWVIDTGDRSRRGIGPLGYQIDGIATSQLPVEAALCADRAVWLPSHDGTLSDLFARAVAAIQPRNEVTAAAKKAGSSSRGKCAAPGWTVIVASRNSCGAAAAALSGVGLASSSNRRRRRPKMATRVGVSAS
jgi:hypothetical protein